MSSLPRKTVILLETRPSSLSLKPLKMIDLVLTIIKIQTNRRGIQIFNTSKIEKNSANKLLSQEHETKFFHKTEESFRHFPQDFLLFPECLQTKQDSHDLQLFHCVPTFQGQTKVDKIISNSLSKVKTHKPFHSVAVQTPKVRNITKIP